MAILVSLFSEHFTIAQVASTVRIVDTQRTDFHGQI